MMRRSIVRFMWVKHLFIPQTLGQELTADMVKTVCSNYDSNGVAKHLAGLYVKQVNGSWATNCLCW